MIVAIASAAALSVSAQAPLPRHVAEYLARESQTSQPGTPATNDRTRSTDSLELSLPMEIEVKKSDIFGHDVFSSTALTFEPNQNIATPLNYKLGPGDEVHIDIWGDNEDSMTATISPEGSIIISQIGPVYLNGLTVNEANNYLRQLFASKYGGMDNDQTQVSLTLGNVRSVTVNIMGEVNVPGTYTLSPFATVFSAIYKAGGINDIGSMRSVMLMRAGKQVADVDLYDIIVRGKDISNMRLQEGDVIIVPTHSHLVKATGELKRPMTYELLPHETIADLLSYAGGFEGNAFVDMVTIARHTDLANTMINVDRDEYNVITLNDGDEVNVGKTNDRYDNRIEIKGAVNMPGIYALDDEITTLRSLIAKAQGLLDDAYLERALIYRQTDTLTPELVSVNLADLMAGKANDLRLRRNDVVEVAFISDIIDFGTVTIEGLVSAPGTYPYSDNLTVEDLVMMAGGLVQGASVVRADVARRIVNDKSTAVTDKIAEVYSVALDLERGQGMKLQPYDIVHIRKSPGYEAQKTVTINGEVLFGGQYVLTTRNERLSQLIERAGGVSPFAYLKGASLSRRMTSEEMQARNQLLKMASNSQNESDSIAVDKLLLSDTYFVGIDLEKALANPGSDYDIVIKEGDIIDVPELTSTVKISGDVMYPAVTTYVPGKNYKHYVNLAGGYGERARKNRAFVVYMNGRIEKLKGSTPIEPGCHIIIPSKPTSEGVNWSQILSITSGFASIGTMAATLYTIFK